MERSIFESEVAEVRDSFAETFGRGCLIKHKEPSYSERNNFEQERFKAERAGRYYPTQSHRHRLPTPHPPTQQPPSQPDDSHRSADSQAIDQINNKICGLIKSISASCHKKLDREGKLPTASHTASKERPTDHQRTEKKRLLDTELPYMKAKLLNFNQKKQDKYPQPQPLPQPHLHAQPLRANEDSFVDINDRIRKINDKITNYENKIKGNTVQPASKDYPRPKPLSEHRDFANKQETPNKLDKNHKFTQNRLKYIENSEAKHKQGTLLQKPDETTEFGRKIAPFNQKHSHTSVPNRQESDRSKYNKEAAEEKAAMGESKGVQQLQRNTISMINEQLLSFKTQFLREMVRQIELDHEFRNAKHMFGGIEGLFEEGSDSHSYKWARLQRELRNEGFHLPLPEVKEIFMPRDDEVDPFMSVSHSHEELIHSLIHAYRACERNWNENMYHSWTLWELRQSKFTAENLDRTRRGTIGLQDLAFFLNTELDGNYRNRDLLLIFNRFRSSKAKGRPGQQEGVRFKEIVDRLLSA